MYEVRHLVDAECCVSIAVSGRGSVRRGPVFTARLLYWCTGTWYQELVRTYYLGRIYVRTVVV